MAVFLVISVIGEKLVYIGKVFSGVVFKSSFWSVFSVFRVFGLAEFHCLYEYISHYLPYIVMAKQSYYIFHNSMPGVRTVGHYGNKWMWWIPENTTKR